MQTLYAAIVCVLVMWGMDVVTKFLCLPIAWSPMVLCPIVGGLLGDFRTGLILGGSLQAIFLGVIGIGGVVPADKRVASIITTAFVITGGLDIEAGIAIAYTIGVLSNTLSRFFTPLYAGVEPYWKKLGDGQISYEDAYREACAQIERFIELIGKKPLFVNGHSFGTESSRLAIADAADRYECVLDGFNEPLLKNSNPNWYRQVPGNKAAYTMQMQLDTDVEEWILSDRLQLLDREYGVISTHLGFCDEELVRMSSFNVIRYKEVYALTSAKVREWIRDNQIELITLEQFYQEHQPDRKIHRERFLAPHPEWGKQSR